MTWKRVELVAAVCAFAWMAGSSDAASPEKMKAAKIGEAAPGFSVTDIDGNKHSLADYKGRIVVLEWTNHQCPFVKRFIGKQKLGQKLHAKFAGLGVVWLSVDSSHFCKDKLEDIKKFRKEAGVRYPLILDPEGKLGKAYGAKATPHVFIINRGGKLVYSGAFDNSEDENKTLYRSYVEEALEALLAGKPVPVSRTKPVGCSVKYAG